MKSSQISRFNFRKIASCGSAALSVAVAAVLSGLIMSNADAAPGRSTTIALTSDETRVVVVNREANSLSIIKVKNANGKDVSNKLAEIAVGQEPHCVAVSPNDRLAFVTNAISATVSVVSLAPVGDFPDGVYGCSPTYGGCSLREE